MLLESRQKFKWCEGKTSYLPTFLTDCSSPFLGDCFLSGYLFMPTLIIQAYLWLKLYIRPHNWSILQQGIVWGLAPHFEVWLITAVSTPTPSVLKVKCTPESPRRLRKPRFLDPTPRTSDQLVWGRAGKLAFLTNY